MVVGEPSINNIMSGLENTGGVKQHNHKKKLKQRFDLIKKLGQGTFGKVQLGINKETGQEVAIKTIKKSKIESEADLIRIRREIQIMSSVQHPNIIHIYEVFENREKMVLVMEYAAGGELYDYLSERKVLSEDEARRIFRQIATACYYCHKHKICHRDLKLENILLDENNNAKIADFGLSNVFDEQRLLNTFCGSPLYASPEIVKGTPYHGPEVDCWSLGVLLYTLVYGAMPFDGSNFKRLVKQISQGDYFEPAKPSPASPLIRDMLTVNPSHRVDIEKICMHWWVNENYDENCYEISEELANQTPVRLDLLLSLAPPPPQLESDKLVVTGDVPEEVAAKNEAAGPTRSQSVGSLMELSHPAERRIKDMMYEEKASPKRKLETTVSTDTANLDKGLKRKDKIVKENTVADISVHNIQETVSPDDPSMSEAIPLNKSLTQTLSREMDVEQTEETIDPSLQGAACVEIIEDAKKTEKDSSKLKRTLTTIISNKLEGINEIPSQENVANNINKENIELIAQETKSQEKLEEKPDTKTATKRKQPIKKKVLTDKNENPKSKSSSPQPKEVKPKENDDVKEKKEVKETPSKPVERRSSRIFEVAEKFQSMITPSETRSIPIEKPKKIVIPGVSVDGFKKEFERKASLTSTSPPKVKSALSRKSFSVDKQKSIDQEQIKNEPADIKESPLSAVVIPEDRNERVRNAVNIISSALDKEGTRKSKSRPCMMRKPPVPFGVSGRSASGNIGMISSALTAPMGPKPFVRPQFDKIEAKQVLDTPEPPEESKTSSAEITLKSATLPRRKTSKAEIKLNYPVPKPATIEFKTEMTHPVQASPKLSSQRSEVIVPVSEHATVNFRASSLEPESKSSPRERIIPIAFERSDVNKNITQPSTVKAPTPRTIQPQKSNLSQRTNSLSRQSTQDSDTETVTSTGEPIRKSPREYIIPIAVEGGGYVTPRAGSLEPSDTTSNASTITSKGRYATFGRPKRFSSRVNDRDSEDESPFTNLHRHSSFGKDSDTEDTKRDAFHMHRLRSTRPKKSTIEHADSVSSGEEDDDDGFDILTAENLFSTLLSRVRDLTQRLNVEDGGRPGFPSSRLLSHFDHGTNFWNFHNRMDPFSRHSSLGRPLGSNRTSESSSRTQFNTPWRRSASRDLATDIDSVFSEGRDPSSRSQPRGDKISKNVNLNLADLDLKKLKLSEEDAVALSYLTPGLSRRIQKQLLAQLAPSEVRKLHRTLSSRNSSDNNPYNASKESQIMSNRRSVDRLPTTLPRKYLNQNESVDSIEKSETISLPKDRNGELVTELKSKSFLPIKSQSKTDQKLSSDNRSMKNHVEETDNIVSRSRINRALSVREPRIYGRTKTDSNVIYSPDSSLSESVASSHRKDSDSVSDISSKAYSTDSYPSISRPPTYLKYSTNPNSSKIYSKITPIPNSVDLAKTDINKPSNPNKRISRFLRPDFFDPPKEDNIYLKEKKEREMETQKVLKEIRDKRKERLSLRRERSASREKQILNVTSLLNSTNEDQFCKSRNRVQLETPVNNSKEEIIPNLKNIHDYVNVTTDKKVMESSELISEGCNPGIPSYVNVEVEKSDSKKVRSSKIARPKSYPAETQTKKIEKAEISPEKESKISRFRKGFVRKGSKEKSKDDKNETNKSINEEDKIHKNKLLQSIEKKLEKFRFSNNSIVDGHDIKVKESGVENVIKRLREQSLPRNLEHCTESGLIKRAVSVEDLSSFHEHSRPLQASRKSVTKILGLFKKYEDADSKNEKVGKKKKVKENKTDIQKKNKKDANIITTENSIYNGTSPAIPRDDSITSEKKIERPRSFLFDKVKHFQNVYNGAKSDSTIVSNEAKIKTSKLPVNSFRRSLNLETALPEPPKLLLPSDSESSKCPTNLEKTDYEKPNRQNLTLDFSKIPNYNSDSKISPVCPPCTSSATAKEYNVKRYSLATTDDSSSAFVSPCDDVSCDSWSNCSDYHTNDLSSPITPNEHIYSGDENESVIDRIRRKSFYTRFNEKKKPRKNSFIRSYRDLDLYKDLAQPTSHDYGSLDRRTYEYANPDKRRSPLVSEEKVSKPHTRCASGLNDYVNVPNRYETYTSKIARPTTILCSDLVDDTLDDVLLAAKSRKYSSLVPPSPLNRKSPSPARDRFPERSTSTNINGITYLEPV